MSDRYFVPGLEPFAAEYLLTGSELHHLRNVSRRRPGDQVELFDGKGLRAQAELLAVDRRQARLRIAHVDARQKPGPALTLACALPKGDRSMLLVEKCTELGVAQLIPLFAQRSVNHPGEGKLERLRRAVVAACKQCRRDHLMQITATVPWPELAARAPPVGWLLHPGAPATPEDLGPRPSIAALGPEGGWTDEEVALAVAHGWQLVSLPGHVLRTETAAMALASWVRLRTPE